MADLNPSYLNDGSLESLLAIRLSIIAKLQQTDSAAPYKRTYTVDGQTFSWTEYRKSLHEELAMVEARIGRARAGARPGLGAAYKNNYRSTFSRSPYVGGTGGKF